MHIAAVVEKELNILIEKGFQTVKLPQVMYFTHNIVSNNFFSPGITWIERCLISTFIIFPRSVKVNEDHSTLQRILGRTTENVWFSQVPKY